MCLSSNVSIRDDECLRAMCVPCYAYVFFEEINNHAGWVRFFIEYIPLDRDSCMKCLADGCYQYGEGAQHKQSICESSNWKFSRLDPPPRNSFKLKFPNCETIKLWPAAVRSLHKLFQYVSTCSSKRHSLTGGAYLPPSPPLPSPDLPRSFTVFYSEPCQYHPVHALVLGMHSTHGE